MAINFISNMIINKENIQSNHGFSLFFNDIRLEYSKSVKDYLIKQGSLLVVVTNKPLLG